MKVFSSKKKRKIKNQFYSNFDINLSRASVIVLKDALSNAIKNDILLPAKSTIAAELLKSFKTALKTKL